MKKLFLIFAFVLFSVFTCNKTTDPKPLTVAERAGTYTGTSGSFSMIIVIDKDGNIKYTATGNMANLRSCTPALNPSSIETSFTFYQEGLVGPDNAFTINFESATTAKLQTPKATYNSIIIDLTKN